MLFPSRRREPPLPRRGGEEERWLRKEAWRVGDDERERKSLEEKSVEVGGERVRARREDFAARLERLRRMEVARASVGGSAMVVRGRMAGLEGEGGGGRVWDEYG